MGHVVKAKERAEVKRSGGVGGLHSLSRLLERLWLVLPRWFPSHRCLLLLVFSFEARRRLPPAATEDNYTIQTRAPHRVTHSSARRVWVKGGGMEEEGGGDQGEGRGCCLCHTQLATVTPADVCAKEEKKSGGVEGAAREGRGGCAEGGMEGGRKGGGGRERGGWERLAHRASHPDTLRSEINHAGFRKFHNIFLIRKQSFA